MLKEDGLHMIKFWFSIDEKEQAKRMIERQTNPLKQWKLSTVDALAQAKWDEYTRHKEAMFERTSTTDSPWLVIDGNDRDKACLESMRYVLNKMKYEDKGDRPTPEPTPALRRCSPLSKFRKINLPAPAKPLNKPFTGSADPRPRAKAQARRRSIFR